MKKKKSLFLIILCIIVFIVAIILSVIFIRNSIITSVISALCGIFITLLFECLRDTIKYNSSQFSGYYRDEIFSNTNPPEIIKRDKFILKENDGNILSGSFTRYFPNSDNLSNWKCSGFIVLDQFLLSYKAKRDTVASRGVLLLKLDTTRQNGFLPCYTGKYFKYEGEKIICHKINLIQIDETEYKNL